MPSPVDVTIVALAILLPLLYVYRNQLPFIGGKPRASSNGYTNGTKAAASGTANGNGSAVANGNANGGNLADSRDFVAKMRGSSKRCVMFFGSQTGTAEEYAVRLAKEAKSRYGISSLVCDPEEHEFENLDDVPEDGVVFFVMATYGEGEPTDNAQQLMEFLSNDPTFSKGGDLSGLKYVIFGLGNRTYEHFNEVGRKLDSLLTGLGASRIGEVGEGDDDRSMEEDYLAWKDGMWERFEAELGVEEGGSGDVADFVVRELEPESTQDQSKIYHGELSARALLGTKGTHDAKNPYAAPVAVARELFHDEAGRNCIHVELDIAGSGVTYQHGDHVGVWPSNPDVEVERMLGVLGLTSKRNTAVAIESLDPQLAKVPFPQPATYDAIFRHYIDISATASRQTCALLSKFAPNPEAASRLERLGSDKEAYAREVDGPALKVAEVLQYCGGADSVWSAIPFDRIVGLPRLQPRFYSISSSPKLHSDRIHITAVVLRYDSQPSVAHGGKPRTVYGLGTNYILNIQRAAGKPTLDQPVANASGAAEPTYALAGPRSAHYRDSRYHVPIHVRRSTFRLPTSPKVPVIMIGPGTGVAPFRGFVQERVAAARKAKAKAGLDDWADIWLFYGCRNEHDYLYNEEWPEYAAELEGKLHIEVAQSRTQAKKVYVQDLIWENRAALAPLILEKRAYVYICGDAKGMAKSVEEMLVKMLGEKSTSGDGAKELKLLKERNVSLIGKLSRGSFEVG